MDGIEGLLLDLKHSPTPSPNHSDCEALFQHQKRLQAVQKGFCFVLCDRRTATDLTLPSGLPAVTLNHFSHSDIHQAAEAAVVENKNRSSIGVFSLYYWHLFCSGEQTHPISNHTQFEWPPSYYCLYGHYPGGRPPSS